MKIDSLDLTNDIMELIYNPILKYRPFLLRIINFNNEKYELRLNENELNQIGDFIKNYSKGEIYEREEESF